MIFRRIYPVVMAFSSEIFILAAGRTVSVKAKPLLTAFDF